MKVRLAALVGAASVVFATSAFAQARDHVVCYAAKPSKKACTNVADAGKLCEDDLGCSSVIDACASLAKFPKGVLARLDDNNDPNSVGEDKTFNIKKPTRLCIPVDKNDEGINDATVNYATYPVKQAGAVCNGGTSVDMPCKEAADCPPAAACVEIAKFDGKASKNVNILLEDQYTNIRLNAGKVDFLMVPSSRCDGNDDAACVQAGNAAPAANTQEHYKCYKAKATKTVCSASTTGGNAFNACDDDLQCPGGVCADLLKFTKGQDGFLSGDFIAGERTFGLGKISHFCTAVEKTHPPGLTGIPEGPVNPDARMICYKSKATKGACIAASPTNAFGACKGDEDCGGIDGVPPVECVEQLKFDKENVNVLGLYANDQFDIVDGSAPVVAGDYHRTNLAKEDIVCMPACEGNDLTFTSHVLRANTLSIPPTGNPGDGQDVDNSMATCQPGGMCSAGIDNILGVISGFVPDLNMALQDSVDSGDINIVLELNTFANGAQQVNGYTGDVDGAPCTDNDPMNPPTDVNDPSKTCNYNVTNAAFDLSTCDASSDINFDVNVTLLPASPAHIAGGGIGSNLSFSLPFGEIPVSITARNVKVSADVTHTLGVVESATGALGGAINQRELKAAINSLPEGICDGGANSGDPCTVATETTDCPSSFCDTAYLGGFDKATIAGLIETLLLRDIDLDGLKTCEGGTNNGQSCMMDSTCPDQFPPSPPACDQNDAHSVGIKFTGINAAISDFERPCDKATCSLY